LSANTPLRLESEVRPHRFSRQPKRQPVSRDNTLFWGFNPAVSASWAPEPGEICHRPRRIDERNVAYSELCRLIHLGHCSLPSDLEEYEIMIRAIAANIPVALYPVIRATGVRGPPPDLYRSCLKPACIEGTHPTGKGVRRRDLDVAPAIRSEQRSPRLEIQQRRAANIVALKHYRLRLLACLGETKSKGRLFRR
jgi:hypothetical protein